jgi:predicted helicase
VPKDFGAIDVYNKGFAVDKLFCLNGVGICTKRDNLAYQDTEKDLLNILNDFSKLDELSIKNKHNIQSESRDQKVIYAKNNVMEYGIKDEYIKTVLYRPFDKKVTYFTNKSKGFLAYPVYNIMRHFLQDNIAIVIGKQGGSVGDMYWNLAFVSKNIVDLNLYYRGGAVTMPLYIYDDDMYDARRPNFNPEIIQKFEQTVGKAEPLAILDYIYAVLHSPKYRETYKEFLKIDFPRVPYPADKKIFSRLAKIGGKLRQIHLLEAPLKFLTAYPVNGDNKVEKIIWTPDGAAGRVYINAALAETTRLMPEIDAVKFL